MSTEEVRNWSVPPIDVLHREGSWRLLVDLPGVQREAVSLTIDDGLLTLVAQRSDVPGQGYRRRFRLPDEVDTGQVDAELKDGVLSVTLQPLPATRGRTVEIRA